MNKPVRIVRRLPLAKGYKGVMPIYASFGGGKIPIEVEVTGKETVEVPAGKFECYKLHLTSSIKISGTRPTPIVILSKWRPAASRASWSRSG